MNIHLPVLLVCGGRDYFDDESLYRYLDGLAFWYGGNIIIVTGAARGADSFAEAWARTRQQIYMGFPAQWDKYGKRAGMSRNAEMAAIAEPDAVVVFRGGRGTRGMLSIARHMDSAPKIWLPDGEFWK